MAEIRRPTVREITELARLDREVFGEHSYAPISMRQFYDLAGPLLLVAVDGEALLGYGLALPSAVNGEGWFMALGVRAECRRTGVGKRLAERIIAEADQLGIVVLRLTVEPTNQAAIALYATLGFETENIVTEYFGHGENRQVMCRQGRSRTLDGSLSSLPSTSVPASTGSHDDSRGRG